MLKKDVVVLVCSLAFFGPALFITPLNSTAWAQSESADELDLDEDDEEEAEDEFEDDDLADEDSEDFEDEDFEDSPEEEEKVAEISTDDSSENEEVAEEELDDEDEQLEPLSDEEIAADEQNDQGSEVLEEEPPIVAEEEDFIEEEPEAVEEVVQTAAPESQAVDVGPDLEYEANLYQIYKNYHSEETSSEHWNSLLSGREAELYSIQKGDTLWGISELFFGDGNYWPKIWSLNGGITNPHLVKKGHTIGFILGNEESAPAFTVTEGDGAELQTPEEPELSETTVSTKKVNEDGPEIPPPSFNYPRVLKRLPPSLPSWQSSDAYGEFSENGLSIIPRKIPKFKETVSINAFIDSDRPKKLGRIVEVETGFKIAALYQYVYVKMKPGIARVGDKFLIVKDQGPIWMPKGIDSEGDERRYQIQGEVKLIDFSNLDRDDEDEDYKLEHFRALIVGMIEPVTTGSILIKGSIKAHDVSMNGTRSRVVAQIIGGTLATNRRLFTTGSLVFLNRGTLAGLNDGAILPVRANRQSRKEYSMVLDSHRPVGWLKVVKAAKKYSTAIIIQAWDSIKAGDFTGLGKLMPRGSVNSEVISESSDNEIEGQERLEVKNSDESDIEEDLLDEDSEDIDSSPVE